MSTGVRKEMTAAGDYLLGRPTKTQMDEASGGFDGIEVMGFDSTSTLVFAAYGATAAEAMVRAQQVATALSVKTPGGMTSGE